jgi:hypothetical protein
MTSKYITLLILLICSLLHSFSISAQTPSTNNQTEKLVLGKIETIQDFEASLFYKQFRPMKGDYWKLKTGGVNTVYSIPNQPNIAFEMQTIGQKVIGFGITFYESRIMLNNDDMAFVTQLLLSIDAKHTNSQVTHYIKHNAIKSIRQIHKVRPISFGAFEIYAGKVIDPVISIERAP